MTKSKRRALALLCVGVGIVVTMCLGQRAQVPPNVIVIVVDALRADAVSLAPGNSKTPRLAALAGEGLPFSLAFAHTPLTLPSHTSIFSGRHPAESGVLVDGQRVRGNLPLLAEHLANAGYQTRAVLSLSALEPESRGSGLDRGFERYDLGRFKSSSAEHTTPRLEAALNSLVPDRPFFLFAHFADTHEVYGNRIVSADATPSTLNEVASARKQRNRYHEQVAHADAAVGSLLDNLKRRGLYENSLIVFTSDHGEALGEHGTFGHAVSLYDELLHVPLILRLPHGRRDPGLVGSRESLVRHVDLVPTILEELELSDMAGAAGSSLFDTPNRVLLAETHQPAAPKSLFCARDDKYKLIYSPAEDEFEMYRLGPDPLELDNVFQHQGHLRITWQFVLKKLATETSTKNARKTAGVVRPAAAY